MGITPEDAVVEIGPGLGALTREIAAIARRTIAIEVDRGLVKLLGEEEWPGIVEIRHQDALKADLGGISRELGPPNVLLGNLPYSIAGRLIAALCSERNPYRRWGLMIQAEMADRVMASPGDAAYGTLSVWARLWTSPQRVMELGPGHFEPRPKVRSTFLVFDPAPDPPLIHDVGLLRKVVRTAFQYRRKTLRRALASEFSDLGDSFERAEVDPKRRGETLSELEFARLANAMVMEPADDRDPRRTRS